MIASALVIGFLSAIGWWAGNKVTTYIDDQPVCEVKK